MLIWKHDETLESSSIGEDMCIRFMRSVFIKAINPTRSLQLFPGENCTL